MYQTLVNKQKDVISVQTDKQIDVITVYQTLVNKQLGVITVYQTGEQTVWRDYSLSDW